MGNVHERRREKESLLSAEMAREIWDMDQDSDGLPILLWRQRPISEFYSERDWRWWNSKNAGRVAGSATSKGYIRVKLDGVEYPAHRIIFLMTYSRWPEEELDHIDQDRTNNRIENLREVSHRENMRNQRMHSNNKSGVIGVCWHKQHNAWVAQIRDQDGRMIHLGYHATLEEARFARRQAEIELGYSENHGRRRVAKA